MTDFGQHPTLPGSRQHSLSGSRSLRFSSVSRVSYPDEIPSSDSELEQITLRGRVTRHNSIDQGHLASPPCVVGLTLIGVSAARTRERMTVMSKPASRDCEAYFAPLRRIEQ